MEFSVNHPILFILVGILIAVVLGQSVYFLAKALRRSKELGMDQAKIKKTIKAGSKAAKDYDFTVGDITLDGKVKFIWYEFKCTGCGNMTTEADMKAYEKRVREEAKVEKKAAKKAEKKAKKEAKKAEKAVSD